LFVVSITLYTTHNVALKRPYLTLILTLPKFTSVLSATLRRLANTGLVEKSLLHLKPLFDRPESLYHFYMVKLNVIKFYTCMKVSLHFIYNLVFRLKHKTIGFSVYRLRLGVLCVFVLFWFCHGALKLDMSTLLTTFFLWTSLQQNRNSVINWTDERESPLEAWSAREKSSLSFIEVFYQW